MSLVHKNPISLNYIIDKQQKFCGVVFRPLLLKSDMAIMRVNMPLFLKWFGCAVKVFC